MEYRDLPSAWKEAPRAMHAPAMQKLMEMIRRAGMPTESMVSVASNIFSRGPGMTQKRTVPKTMMMEAYSAPRLMVSTMRLRFRAP